MPELQRDAHYPLWRSVGAQLADDPADNRTGLLIGDGVALTTGHRHWSHLFSLFPTTLRDPSAETSEGVLARQSLDHYAAENGAENYIPAIQNGFPRVAISIMSSMVPGRAGAAYANISNWLTWAAASNSGRGGGSFAVNLGPNTL